MSLPHLLVTITLLTKVHTSPPFNTHGLCDTFLYNNESLVKNKFEPKKPKGVDCEIANLATVSNAGRKRTLLGMFSLI